MRKLIKGIVDFRQKSIADYREKFAKLAAGQHPDALLIACCDSRVVPNVFASSDPGELLVVRNVGNLVAPFSSSSDASIAAAIEFSVLGLKISDIIICGHSDCAAMRAFFSTPPNPHFPHLNEWLEHAVPSFERYSNCKTKNPDLAPYNELSQLNVLQQLEHLKTYPSVTENLANKTLNIHGWWFDLATADVYHYNQNTQNFHIIDEEEAKKLL